MGKLFCWKFFSRLTIITAATDQIIRLWNQMVTNGFFKNSKLPAEIKPIFSNDGNRMAFHYEMEHVIFLIFKKLQIPPLVTLFPRKLIIL